MKVQFGEGVIFRLIFLRQNLAWVVTFTVSFWSLDNMQDDQRKTGRAKPDEQWYMWLYLLSLVFSRE